MAGAIAMAAVAFASCGSKTAGSDEATNEAEVSVLTVDQLLAEPTAHVGDTVTVQGTCSHLCAHGGTKAFLLNPDTTAQAQVLLCMATENIGGAFDPTSPEKVLTVNGIVRANTVSASQIEAAYEAQKAEAEAGHCDTESKAFGTVEELHKRLEAQMAENPADTTVVLGIYIETLSYELPVEE